MVYRAAKGKAPIMHGIYSAIGRRNRTGRIRPPMSSLTIGVRDGAECRTRNRVTQRATYPSGTPTYRLARLVVHTVNKGVVVVHHPIEILDGRGRVLYR